MAESLSGRLSGSQTFSNSATAALVFRSSLGALREGEGHLSQGKTLARWGISGLTGPFFRFLAAGFPLFFREQQICNPKLVMAVNLQH